MLEDKAPQTLKSFVAETNLPLTLGILLDTSGSQQRVLPLEQQAGSQFLEQVLRKQDEAFLISFDVNVDLLQDYTNSPRLLAHAMDKAEINTAGGNGGGVPGLGGGTVPTGDPKGTVFYDAIYQASNDKLNQETGRKAMIILTDGEDEGSDHKIGDAIAAAEKEQRDRLRDPLCRPRDVLELGRGILRLWLRQADRGRDRRPPYRRRQQRRQAAGGLPADSGRAAHPIRRQLHAQQRKAGRQLPAHCGGLQGRQRREPEGPGAQGLLRSIARKLVSCPKVRIINTLSSGASPPRRTSRRICGCFSARHIVTGSAAAEALGGLAHRLPALLHPISY